MKLGVIAIARPTFDVPFAQETAEAAFSNLRSTEHEVVGSADLAMDIDTVERRVAAVAAEAIDALVVLQATFADSSLAVAATGGSVPAVLWAFPEERTGGRLRLNSFCGINLAAFTLTNERRSYGWLLAPPDAEDLGAAIERALSLGSETEPVKKVSISETSMAAAQQVARRLSSTVIGRVGDGPDGFEPCAYEADVLTEILGVTVDEVPLPELFARSSAATVAEVAAVRSTAASHLSGLDTVDQDSLDQSLRMNVGLRSLIAERGWSGVATRCWPETFTEFGGAACTPMSLLNDQHTPAGILGVVRRRPRGPRRAERHRCDVALRTCALRDGRHVRTTSSHDPLESTETAPERVRTQARARHDRQAQPVQWPAQAGRWRWRDAGRASCLLGNRRRDSLRQSCFRGVADRDVRGPRAPLWDRVRRRQGRAGGARRRPRPTDCGAVMT